LSFLAIYFLNGVYSAGFEPIFMVLKSQQT